jgi:GNAT superfamily N-acetyltransferase
MALHRFVTKAKIENDLPFCFQRLRTLDHWRTVKEMYRNYPGVDSHFDQAMNGVAQRFFLRWVGLPLYFLTLNRGFGLWLNTGELAGQLYLQHRRMVTHVNDIEVNRPFQGRGLSHKLLSVAEQEARHHHKTFLTLAVTLSNTRALELYRKSGFLDQHHHFFYLSRAWWSEPATPAAPPTRSEVRFVPLDRRAAHRNMLHWFAEEVRAGDPVTAPVWEALYRPTLPRPTQGFSFALYWEGQLKPQGHADFFNWDNRGRWRIYIDPALWGTPAERALFEALLYQARQYNQLGLMVGTSAHHSAARAFTRDLGLVERETERMLMIRPLI